MLCNLKAEMARYNVSPVDVARIIGKTDRSIRDKISGKYDFTINECNAIRNNFFPDMSLEYLFASDSNQKE